MRRARGGSMRGDAVNGGVGEEFCGIHPASIEDGTLVRCRIHKRTALVREVVLAATQVPEPRIKSAPDGCIVPRLKAKVPLQCRGESRARALS